MDGRPYGFLEFVELLQPLRLRRLEMSITLKINPLEEYDPRQLQIALFGDDSETEDEDRNGEHSFSLAKPLDEDENDEALPF